MNTLSRKEKNILSRQNELVDLALDIIETDGISGLTMDKLTSDSDYSKGTIYNHFAGKEDVLCAISIQCLDELNNLFTRAIKFNGNTREKLIAVQFAYLLYSQLKPTQFMCVLSCKTSAVAEKTSENFNQISLDKEIELMALLNQLVHEAVKHGDLTLTGTASAESITFSNWASSFGTLSLLLRADASHLIKQLNLQQTFLNNICINLDGLNWKPLSQDFDYQQTVQRIKDEIFASEIQLLELA